MDNRSTRRMSSREEHEAAGPGLNISALARRAGVGVDTLRKWEQRYGVIRPTRTSGGQRRYTDRDAARVEWLRDRLAEGYRIGEAARLLGEAAEPAPAKAPAKVRAQLLEAIERSDAGAASSLLDHSLFVAGVESTLTQIVAPILEEIGKGWEEGRLSVAQEHLATETIRSRLVTLLADARGAVRGVAVLACPAGERHDMGLLMLAVLLRGDGWQVAYLGADTPVADAFGLAEQLDARVVALSLVMPKPAAALRTALARRPPRAATVVVGGRGASGVASPGSSAVHVSGDPRQGVRRLRRYAA
jgi:methanogenic corrinoid protein MtbC1